MAEHHPSIAFWLQFFEYGHLPEHLQAISKPFCELAHQMADTLPSNPATTEAIKHLFHAKNLAVISILPK